MLKVGSKIGKYKIQRKIADGGFATVYQARDTIEGIKVALKVPQDQFMTKTKIDELFREVHLTTKLNHPNILPIKDANIIDDLFVIAYPLGLENLEERLKRRLSRTKALSLAQQAIEALSYAHRKKIIHCDIKPENFILFIDETLRLTDFGISRLALSTRTLASGQGTIGYIAPEQAMGRPSLRSDIFSMGLLLYRMFSGHLPQWPFQWPMPGIERLRDNMHPDFIAFLRRSIEVNEKKRFRDASAMLYEFRRTKSRALRTTMRKRREKHEQASATWKTYRIREFKRRYGKILNTNSSCPRCTGPIAETMMYCPWCAHVVNKYQGPVDFPRRCKRCGRGMKSDWLFCAWCYGPKTQIPSSRHYTDKRYSASCSNPNCRQPLMLFMRYCPWCRSKITKKWQIAQSKDRCPTCGWGVISEFWDECPWCSHRLKRK